MKTQILLLLVSLSMISCAIGPTAKMPDGSWLTLGGSAASKTKNDVRSATMPNGLVLKWVRQGIDETQVPKAGFALWGTVAAIDGMTAVTNSNNALKATNSNNLLKAKESVNALKATESANALKAAELKLLEPK